MSKAKSLSMALSPRSLKNEAERNLMSYFVLSTRIVALAVTLLASVFIVAGKVNGLVMPFIVKFPDMVYRSALLGVTEVIIKVALGYLATEKKSSAFKWPINFAFVPASVISVLVIVVSFDL